MVYEGLARRLTRFERPQGLGMEMSLSQHPNLFRDDAQVAGHKQIMILWYNYISRGVATRYFQQKPQKDPF